MSRSLEYNQVNLTIDLGQEFHVAYIYIKMANSPRPGVWALEKSTDYGKTYQTWQYFADTASDCFNFFNTTANKRIMSDDDVICTTDYSKVLPVEGGEVSQNSYFTKFYSFFDLHQAIYITFTQRNFVHKLLMSSLK